MLTVAATLAELLAPRTKEEEFTTLQTYLQAQGFPVSSWQPGDPGRTTFEVFAWALADFSKLLPKVAQGGFVTLAKTLADPGWLDLLAEYAYDITRARATYTRQICQVSCQLGFGPQTIPTDFTIRSAATGHRYLYKGEPVDVPDNLHLDLEFQAESPGAKYADGPGTINEVVTSLTGVTVTNPNTKFGGVDSYGFAKRNTANQGSGTITPSHVGVPAEIRFYTITVLATGSEPSTGSVQIKYEKSGVITVLAPISPIPASSGAAGDGVTLAFGNGAGTGFVAGDIHTFQTPGTPITNAGTDDETNEALAARCLGRWPSLSLNIVADKYVAWIRQCSLDSALGIEKITIRPSTTVAGQANILVATASGAVPGASLDILQAYVNARDGITDAGEVLSAVGKPVTPAGNVTVKAADLVAAKAAADAAWLSYISGLPIGGDVSTGTPGLVRLAELVQALMDAGAIDYSGLQLNDAAANLALATNEVATVWVAPSENLTWTTVA
jgi:hypothetical protein